MQRMHDHLPGSQASPLYWKPSQNWTRYHYFSLAILLLLFIIIVLNTRINMTISAKASSSRFWPLAIALCAATATAGDHTTTTSQQVTQHRKKKTSSRHLRDGRQLNILDSNNNGDSSPPIPTLFIDNEDGDGLFDGFSIFDDEDGNGMPDVLDGLEMPDWTNMDWANSPLLENIDWGNINWNPDEWNGFLQNLLGGANGIGADGSLPPIEFCPILEAAVGIGQNFGIAGDCSCEGNLGDGLSIDCKFEECLEGSAVCGTIGLNVTVEDSTGLVKTTACLDTATEQYKEICFSYQLDMTGGGGGGGGSSSNLGNIFDLEHSCAASYGGQACDCTMEDRCLSIDCEAYLPGAKMDTCQYLSFDRAEDAVSLMPRFAIFDESFDGTFSFENIEWPNLDWENLDWNNFGFDQVNWTNLDWASTPWGSLFNNDMTQIDICPILTGRVLGLSEDMMMGSQGCSCEGELESGFNVLCSFKQECAPPAAADADGEIAIAAQEDGASLAALPMDICGDVALDLAFDNLGSVTGNLCVQFAEDVHPITCIEYSMPIADRGSLPTCKATYGGELCDCNIDENLCVKIDCGIYDPSAVMDTCQILGIENQDDVARLVPRFGIPSPVVEPEDETKDEDADQEVGVTPEKPALPENEKGSEIPSGDLLVAESNSLENNDASGAFSATTFTIAGMVALLSAVAL